MCRSAAQGGRRCSGGHTATTGGGATQAAQRSLTRAQFLAGAPRDLVTIDGTDITVPDRPRGVSDRAYVEHLDATPMTITYDNGLRTRVAWPLSARAMVRQARMPRYGAAAGRPVPQVTAVDWAS